MRKEDTEAKILTPEYTKLKKDIRSAYKMAQKYSDRARALSKLCTHEEAVSKTYHNDGGHDYKGYTDYWDECTLCGLRFNQTTIHSNFFG